MPTCYHQKCQRQDLPFAAGLIKLAKTPSAHVRPDGEPCDPPGTYPSDVVETILDDDSMWDLDAEAELEVEEPSPLAAAIAKGDTAAKAAPIPEREDPPARAQILPVRESVQAREPKKPDRRAEPRRRDDKRKKALAPRKPEAPARAEEPEAIDDWDP